MARFGLSLYFLASILLLTTPSYAQMFEENIERAGATYARSTTGRNSPQQCWNACSADSKCKAWSWERPGIKEPLGICSLKSAITPAQISPCCISGLSQKLEQQVELGLGDSHRGSTALRKPESWKQQLPNPQRFGE